MLESLKGNTLEYERLSPEEMKARGILGRLIGPCADFMNATRNGRKYTEELWERTFSDPIMKERIENGVCYGELGHPIDREETDMEKIAICLSEVPKKDSNGKLRAVFDILDTPNGRILKSLCDYGSTLGISSRGSGDIITDFDGEESVDPTTYDCQGFDIVLIPAVKEARLQYVNESLNSKTLKQTLKESLDNASESDREIMQETLHNLNIDLTEDETKEKLKNDDSAMAVDDNKAIVEELRQLVKENTNLANTITSLQEKLSVSYAKESELRAKNTKYTNSATRLAEEVKKVKPLTKKVEILQTKLKNIDEQIEKDIKVISQLKKANANIKSQNEQLKQEIIEKEQEIISINESINQIKQESSSKEQSLHEDIKGIKKDTEIKLEQYEKQITKYNKLIEQYKKMANTAVDKYIQSQAHILGLNINEVKNKLPESYTFKDIDEVCDDLRSYKLTISKLPFNSSRNLNENIHIKATSVKPSIMPEEVVDDVVDEQLKNLAGI